MMMVRKRYKKRTIMLGFLAVLAAVLILTFYIWHQAESIHLGYSIGDLEKKVMDLEQEVEKLEAEKSRLLSLERVESIARTHLNLILPEKDQMIFAETTDNDSDHE
jgi:cell division protein FtsL